MALTLDQLIDEHEGAGNVDTLFGHSQRDGGRFAGVRPSQMTVAEVLAFQDPSGDYGQWVKRRLGEMGHEPRVATPAGRYQIVGTTLRNATNQLGIDPSTPFDAATQRQIAGHLASRRLAGLSDPAAKRAAMRAEWEGFKHVSNADLDAAIAHYEATGEFGDGTPASGGSGGSGPRMMGVSGQPAKDEPESYTGFAGVAPGAIQDRSRFESALGRGLGLNEGGARDKLLAQLGLENDTANRMGRSLAGIGGALGNMRF